MDYLRYKNSWGEVYNQEAAGSATGRSEHPWLRAREDPQSPFYCPHAHKTRVAHQFLVILGCFLPEFWCGQRLQDQIQDETRPQQWIDHRTQRAAIGRHIHRLAKSFPCVFHQLHIMVVACLPKCEAWYPRGQHILLLDRRKRPMPPVAFSDRSS